MLKINTNDAIYLDEFFIVIVASVSESDTLYMCHGHVTRNAKSREHTYACIVSPYVCVFVLEKLREHRLHWCHVVPGWLSPRRIASRCYVKNGNEPQTSSSSSFPSSPSLSFLISSSFSLSVPSFYPYSLSFSYFSSFPLFSILLCIIFLFHDFVLAFRRPWPLLRISFSTRLSFRTSFSSFLTTSSPYFLFHSSSSVSNQCCRWSPRLKIKLSCISCYSQALPRRGAERMRCRMLRIWVADQI